MKSIGIASIVNLPPHEHDDEVFVKELESRNIKVDVIPWTDEKADWSKYDLVLIRYTWDYHENLPAFLDWAKRVASTTKLFNSEKIVRWNTHKSYLRELNEAVSAPLVETIWIDKGSTANLGELLKEWKTKRAFLKPCVGLNASDTIRFDPSNAEELNKAQEQLNALLKTNDFMLQPYQESVESEGEYSVIIIDGIVTHSVQKIPVKGDYRVQDDFGAWDGPATLKEEDIETAKKCWHYVQKKFPDILYARLDYLRDVNGVLCVNEFELVEPSLFFRHGANCPKGGGWTMISCCRNHLKMNIDKIKLRRENTTVELMLAGGLSRVAAQICLHPADTIKTRMQFQGKRVDVHAYRSARHALWSMIRNEGASSLYAGISARLLYVMPASAFNFVCYEYIAKYFRRHPAKESFRQRSASDDKQDRSNASWAATGMIGGRVVASVVRTPLDVIKQRQQIHGALLESGDGAKARLLRKGLMRRLLRDIGLRNLFKLAPASLMRDVPFMSIYFGSYELFQYTQAQLWPETAMRTESSSSAAWAAQKMVGGGLAGMVASVCTAPFDTVKTRLQVQQTLSAEHDHYKGVIDCFRRIRTEEDDFGAPPILTVDTYWREGVHCTVSFHNMDLIRRIQGALHCVEARFGSVGALITRPF